MSKNKKTKKRNIFKSTSIIFATITICLAILAVFLLQNQKSNEEKKRLQVFESLVANYMQDSPFTQDKEHTYTHPINIGISEDNDLYVEFQYLVNDEQNLPYYTSTGRIYFQCGDGDGKVIGSYNPGGCARAMSYDDKKYISEEVRENYRKMNIRWDEYATRLNALNEKLEKGLLSEENYYEEVDSLYVEYMDLFDNPENYYEQLFNS